MDTEMLRQKLLDEIYAGAFAGMPAMLTLEDEIQSADAQKLISIAENFGMI